MPKLIELPDGQVAEFPDAMGDDAISEVLRKQFPSSAPASTPAPPTEEPSLLNRAWGTYQRGMELLHKPTEMWQGALQRGAEHIGLAPQGSSNYSMASNLQQALFPSGPSEPLPAWARVLLAPSGLGALAPVAEDLQREGHPDAAAAVAGVGRGASGRALELGTSFENVIPFGGKVGATLFAPGVGASAVQGISNAAQIYKEKGLSQEFWQALAEAGVDSTFFVLIAKGLRKGKTVEEAVQEAQAPAAEAPTPQAEMVRRIGNTIFTEGDTPISAARFARRNKVSLATAREMLTSLQEQGKVEPLGKDTWIVKQEGTPATEAPAPEMPDASTPREQPPPPTPSGTDEALASMAAAEAPTPRTTPGTAMASTLQTTKMEGRPKFSWEDVVAGAKERLNADPNKNPTTYSNPIGKVGQVVKDVGIVGVDALAKEFTREINSKTGTFILRGPSGEKVAGRVYPDRIEMVSIGKGTAQDSRVAVEALRQFGQAQGKPVLFTSTNLSPSGGDFRSRMVARGDLTPTQRGYLLSGTGSRGEGAPTPEESATALFQQGMRSSSGQPPGKMDLASFVDSVLKQREETGPRGVGKKSESGFAMNPAGPILDLVHGVGRAVQAADRGTKKAVSFLDDYLRASVAGTLRTTARNIVSGVRMTGQTVVTLPAMEAAARARSAWYHLNGRTAEAAETLRAAKIYSMARKSFAKLGPREVSEAVLDMASLLQGKGRVTEHGDFLGRLEVLNKFGLQKEATLLKNFSTPEISREGFSGQEPDTFQSAMRKTFLVGNIGADRAVTRVYLASFMDAIQNAFGAKSPKELAALSGDPTLRPIIRNYLEFASTEAMRTAWNLPYAKGSEFQNAFRSWGEVPVLGILTQPFARAFAANYLPNIVEMTPGLHLLSQRVRNSYRHNANEILMREIDAKLKEPTLVGSARVTLENERAKLATQNRQFRDTGIYSMDAMHTRMLLGPVITAAAMAMRYFRGDDKTEFDELAVGGTPRGEKRNASMTSYLGEWLPYVFLGDYLGHLKLFNDGKVKNFKYEGKAGMFQPERVVQAFYGSKYGYTSAASEFLTALYDSAFRGKDIGEDYVKEAATKILSDAGKMATSFAWAGDAVRSAFGQAKQSERANRRTDLTPWAGAQSNIPGLRTHLPPSISWLRTTHGEEIEPLVTALTGLSQSDRGPIEEFINDHQGVLKARDVGPRRTGDPAYDEINLEKWTKNIQGKILPMLAREDWQAKPEAEKVQEFIKGMRAARTNAQIDALRTYKAQTGTLPEDVIKQGAKAQERKENQRLQRGAPQFPTRPRPTPKPSEVEKYRMEQLGGS